MDDPCATFTSHCGHCFHAKCFIMHLYNDVRCPNCRAFPVGDRRNEDYTDDDDSLLDEPPIPGVPFKDALKTARRSTDRFTKQTLGTIRKWKSAKRDAVKHLKEIAAELAPSEAEVEQRLQLAEEELWAKHRKKHASNIIMQKKAMDDIAKARTAYRSAEMRLALKHGFVRGHRY